MENQINISNITSNISYSNNNSNLNQDITNNSFNQKSTQYYSKKKNPKEMSIEELEEYIQKNRAKINKIKNNEPHSLNASFTRNYNFGFLEKVDTNKSDVSLSIKRNQNIKQFINQNKKEDLNINIKNNLFDNNENVKNKNNNIPLNIAIINNKKYFEQNPSSVINDINNINKLDDLLNNDTSNKNLFERNVNIEDDNKEKIENKIVFSNTQPLTNKNLSIPSPTFKNIHNTLNYSLNNENDIIKEIIINNQNNGKLDYNSQQDIYQNKELNSNSTINYIKSLQLKINKLIEENENLKNIIQKNNYDKNLHSRISRELELCKNKIIILEQEKINMNEESLNMKQNYEKEIIELRNENENLRKNLEEKNNELENIEKKK